MSKKNNFRFLLLVYVCLVILIILIGIMGILGVRRVYMNPEDYNLIFYSSIAAVFLCSIGTIIIVIYMNRYIERKLTGLRSFAEKMSEYDLTEEVDGSGSDAFGKTINAINDARFKLHDTMEQLKADAENISDSSRDSSEAIRKAYEQIEDLNLKVIQCIDLIGEDYIGNRRIWRLKNNLEDTAKELAETAQYLKQIAVTADYQHEISDRYYKQLDRFIL